MSNWKNEYQKYVKRELNDAVTETYKFKNKSFSDLMNGIKAYGDFDINKCKYAAYRSGFSKQEIEKLTEDVLNKNPKAFIIQIKAKRDIAAFYNSSKMVIKDYDFHIPNRKTYLKDGVLILFIFPEWILVDVKNKGKEYCVEQMLKYYGDQKTLDFFKESLKFGQTAMASTEYGERLSTKPNIKGRLNAHLAQSGVAEAKITFKPGARAWEVKEKEKKMDPFEAEIRANNGSVLLGDWVHYRYIVGVKFTKDLLMNGVIKEINLGLKDFWKDSLKELYGLPKKPRSIVYEKGQIILKY